MSVHSLFHCTLNFILLCVKLKVSTLVFKNQGKWILCFMTKHGNYFWQRN